MLMEVKNQFKVSFLAFKYGVMREMLNKVSFVTNILFMILNNASFIILWMVFYSLKDTIGGSSFEDVLLLWGISASAYGFAHVMFKNAFDLSTVINNGKLDAYIIQPKNILLQTISGVTPSAFGDILYGYIILFVSGFTVYKFILFTLFSITGSIIMVAVAVIFGSLSFWFNKSESVASTVNSMFTQFATYPEGIFDQAVKLVLYVVVPVGFAAYLPLKVLQAFNLTTLLVIIAFTVAITVIAFMVFYRGLGRYSSSNLMIART